MLIIGLASMVLTSCQKQEDVSEVTEPAKTYVLADLALSLPASTAPRTRMTTDVTQSNGNFRGIQRLGIIPFTSSGKVGLDDYPSYYSSGNTYQDLMANDQDAEQRYFYYQKFYLNRGVKSFLIYGQAAQTTDASPKTKYGSLLTNVGGVKTSEFPNRLTDSPSALNFELEPIYPYDNTTVPTEATLLANYLTQIANTKASDGSWSWKNTRDVQLQTLYQSFINQDVNNTQSEVFDVIAGSSVNIKAYVEKLRADMNSLAPQHDMGTEERSIIDGVRSRLTSYSQELNGKLLSVSTDVNGQIYLGGNFSNYPANIGLPDGAAVLQWTELENGTYAFVPQTEATTLASISGINRYAYPAELYYQCNSTIRTSNEEVPPDSYAGKTWPQVLADLYSSGTAVSSNTKSVAIEETMQYAVAHLSAQVYATAGTLTDGDHRDITIGANDFPITGMIISGQNPVGFDFKPETAETGEDREKFVYDSYLRDQNGGTLYLTKTQTDAFHSLVLQTKERENITVILELRNDSQETFKGLSGYVFPGTKFYLAGKIVLPKKDNPADFEKRVFTQDYTTTVGMKVETLAGAYNVMPNIQSERLEISVKMDLKWIQAEPESVELGD